MKQEVSMGRKSMVLLLITASIGLTFLYFAGRVQATPGSNPGFSTVTLAQGSFGEIEVFNHFISPNPAPGEKHQHNVWLSWQKTKGKSDLYVVNNTWAPGADTGWHTHPGHSLITVTAGTVTAYEGDDPDCKPHAYTVGQGFVDPGGGHVHLIRNEGEIPAQTIAVQVIPAGQPRRIDATDPGNCHF
jgi:quercetin dioxygenase-like cupin family protein